MGKVDEIIKEADLRKNKRQAKQVPQYGHIYVEKDVMQGLKEYCTENKIYVKHIATALIEDFLEEQSYKRRVK